MTAGIDATAFEAEARAFLDAHAPRRSPAGDHGPLGLVSQVRTEAEEQLVVAAARAWQAQLFDAGLGWISGPAAYGGRDLPMSFELIWQDLLGDYEVPSTSPLGVGLAMVAPTILRHGTPAARERYLRALRRGDLVACQLFSEPGAGSDLSAISTSAVRRGDRWILNGQKVWTSRAHFSDIGEILCRTGEPGSRHRGITAFVVDMAAPGVEVRPLRQMSGAAHFNEVFLSDVEVDDSDRLGEVNDGWRVAITTLMNERAFGLGDTTIPLRRIADRLVGLARRLGRLEEPPVRQRLAALYADALIDQYRGARVRMRVAAGGEPGAEGSIGKLAYTESLRRAASLAADLLGAQITADTGVPDTYSWNELLLGAPGYRIAGGSDEIQRNTLAERVLGLPRA